MSENDPYRTNAFALATHARTIKKPSKTALAARITGWSALSLGMLALPISLASAALLMYSTLVGGGFVEYGFSRRWYWRARRIVETMPFPIQHQPGGDTIPKASGRAIDHVRVVLETAAVPHAIEQIVRRAQQVLPTFAATTEPLGNGTLDQVITLVDWPNGDDDIVVLANLLSTWGREVHDAYKIRGLSVVWRAIAPAPEEAQIK